MTARLALLGLIFSLILAAPASGQECPPTLDAETGPFNEHWPVEILAQRVEKNNTIVNSTPQARFFCKAAGTTSQIGPLRPASTRSLLRVEFARWENEAWLPGAAEQYVYDENGVLVNKVFQSWDGDSWENTSQAVFENDDRGRSLTFISQFWEGESWQNIARRINTWNELDELVETVREDWGGGAWVTRRRDLMSYENGLLVEEVLETHDGMKWSRSFRYSQEYDDQGRQVRSLSEYYDDSRWIADGQGTIVYGDNYSEASSQAWDKNARDWFTYSRSVTEFNNRGNPVVDTREGWIPDEGWAFTNRVMYTYNDFGFAAEQLVQKFEGTEWQNSGLYTNTYDGEGNLIARLWSSWESDQNRWSNRSKRTFIYDEAPVVEEGDVYSLVSIDLYPVPARDLVQIDITLDKPTHLIVDIHDLLGRQVVRLRDKPLANGALKLDWQPGDLPAGVYLVRIHTGQRVYTKKLILVK